MHHGCVTNYTYGVHVHVCPGCVICRNSTASSAKASKAADFLCTALTRYGIAPVIPRDDGETFLCTKRHSARRIPFIKRHSLSLEDK